MNRHVASPAGRPTAPAPANVMSAPGGHSLTMMNVGFWWKLV